MAGSPQGTTRLGLACSGSVDQLLRVISTYGPGNEADEEGRFVEPLNNTLTTS